MVLDSNTLAWELAFQALLVADARQSAQIRGDPKYYERNALVRRYGNRYFVAAGVGHGVVTFVLPERYRGFWQVGTVAVQAGVVGHNYHIGLRVKL